MRPASPGRRAAGPRAWTRGSPARGGCRTTGSRRQPPQVDHFVRRQRGACDRFAGAAAHIIMAARIAATMRRSRRKEHTGRPVRQQVSIPPNSGPWQPHPTTARRMPTSSGRRRSRGGILHGCPAAPTAARRSRSRGHVYRSFVHAVLVAMSGQSPVAW